MRITVDIDGYSPRQVIRRWWNRRLCAWLGHPKFEEPDQKGFITLMAFDLYPRCVRCGKQDRSRPIQKLTPGHFEWQEKSL